MQCWIWRSGNTESWSGFKNQRFGLYEIQSERKRSGRAAMGTRVRKLVIASNNAGKLREIAHLLEPLGFEVSAAKSRLDFTEAEEPHAHSSKTPFRRRGTPALHGFAGAGGRFRHLRNLLEWQAGHLFRALRRRTQDRMSATIRNWSNRFATRPDRQAYYYCVIVLLRHAEDPQPLIADGIWHGEIVLEPRGQGRIRLLILYFFLPELGKTAAELPMEQKNRVSHRGQALAQLVKKIRDEGL